MTKQSSRLKNVHPGEVLNEEFLKPFDISRYRLAKDIAVDAGRIGQICSGERAITADTALRLAKYFGTSARFWLGLQEDFDLEEQAQLSASVLSAIRPYKKTG